MSQTQALSLRADRTRRRKGAARVDYAKAHSVTLWCAVLAKANRGVTKLLPKQMTQLQFRLLEQLTLPESGHVRPVRVARLLVLKPSDVDEAVAVLADQGSSLGPARTAASN